MKWQAERGVIGWTVTWNDPAGPNAWVHPDRAGHVRFAVCKGGSLDLSRVRFIAETVAMRTPRLHFGRRDSLARMELCEKLAEALNAEKVTP